MFCFGDSAFYSTLRDNRILQHLALFFICEQEIFDALCSLPLCLELTSSPSPPPVS